MDIRTTEKQSLRAHYLSRRLETHETYIYRHSISIAERVLGLDIVSTVSRFGLYLPIKNEVRTQTIIDRLAEAGKEVFLPSVDEDEISFLPFAGWERIVPGRYGIPQPSGGVPIAKDKLGAIFVPGIVFSNDKYRIGFGNGYYDRFLAGFSGTTVGLAFDFQVIDRFAVDDHDIPLDIIGTQSRIII